MYGKTGNVKIIIKDFLTNELIMVHEESSVVNTDIETMTSTARAGGFELVPFKTSSFGHLSFIPKEFSIGLLSLVANSELRQVEKTLEVIEKVYFDEDGVGVITNDTPGPVSVINENYNSKANLKEGKVRGPKNQYAYCIYPMKQTVDELKWTPKASERYFRIEVQIPLENKIAKDKNYSCMLITFKKTYLENKVSLMDALLNGSFSEAPMVFKPLELSQKGEDSIEFIFI